MYNKEEIVLRKGNPQAEKRETLQSKELCYVLSEAWASGFRVMDLPQDGPAFYD